MLSGTTPAGTPDDYFAEQWGGSDDPWAQEERWYERRKFSITAASLPAEHYRRGFEPGCGGGFLTERLAARVDLLLAMEREPQGVAATRRRCAARPGVEVVAGRIPGDWPAGTFDLIVLSEVLYYLGDDDLVAVLERTEATLAAGGDIVAVHFRQPVPEHARLGDEVHQILGERWSAPGVVHVEEDFRLETFAIR